MTKDRFFSEWQSRIAQAAWWPVSDDAKRQLNIDAMRETLYGTHNRYSINGPICIAAWHAIGMKGKPTYKALRALA